MQLWKRFFICAAVLALVLAGCDSSGPDPIEPEAATTVPNVITNEFLLEEPPEDDAGPLCWMSFAEGVREGGCRDGSLSVVEYSNEEGAFVEGWNQVTSHVSVPVGWEVYTFHQMWANGKEDMARRQGYVLHAGGTTTAFYDQTVPVIRYGLEYDWQWCRTWNQEAIDAQNVEEDEDANDTVQCLHIEPDPGQLSNVLLIAADDPVGHERLEVVYVPEPEEDS